MRNEEFYYTLLLTQSNAILSLIEIKNKKLKILRKSQFYFSNLDELENQLIEVLKKENKPKNTILFLTHNYLETKTNNLKTEYKEIFTRIFKKTSLNPIGYIETYEAIITFLNKKHSFPLNALIVEIEKNSLSLTIAKGGKNKTTITKPLTDNLKQSFFEILDKITEKPLPTKIYFLNFFEKKREEIEKTRWPKDLFFHHPEVKFLTQDEINESLIKVFVQELIKNELAQSEDEHENKEKLPLGFAPSEGDLKEKKQIPINLPTSLSLKFPNIPNFLKNFSFTKLTFLLLFFITFPSLALIHETFFHKANITVYPQTKEIKVLKSIEFNKNSPIFHLAKKTIQIKKSFKSTGKKNIGKKASGTLKFYNFSTKELIITPKTKISYKSKVYFPKEKLIIPPATEEASGDSIIKKPGTKTGEVEAEKIGEEYNLFTTDKLTIAGFNTDLYFAKIEGKINGGTSETVQTVTKTDLKKAREEVINESLKNINLSEFKFNTNNYIPLKNLATSSIIEEKFDRELGEISNTFTLNAKIKLEIPFLNKNEIIDKFQDEIISQIGENYTFNPEKLRIKLQVDKNTNQTPTIKLTILGNAFQKINEIELKKTLKGKPLTKIHSSLPKSISKIKVLKNTAFLPFFSSRLPYKIKNIKVEFKY